jgi:hypothetical protein
VCARGLTVPTSLTNSVMTDEDPLALGQRRVWEAQKIVAEQKMRIARLRAAGVSTFDAVKALSAFESNLRLFMEHRDPLLSLKRRRQ